MMLFIPPEFQRSNCLYLCVQIYIYIKLYHTYIIYNCNFDIMCKKKLYIYLCLQPKLYIYIECIISINFPWVFMSKITASLAQRPRVIDSLIFCSSDPAPFGREAAFFPSAVHIKHPISMVPKKCGNSLLNHGFLQGGVEY